MTDEGDFLLVVPEEELRFLALLLRERELVRFVLLVLRERDFARSRSEDGNFESSGFDEVVLFFLRGNAAADLAVLDAVSGDTVVDFMLDFFGGGGIVFDFFDVDVGFFANGLGGDFRWAFFLVDLGDFAEDEASLLFLAREVDACFFLVDAMVYLVGLN